jgi:hypothetical protein
MSEFTNNHYVPQWYQRRFMAPGRGKYHYLDLRPEVRISNGHTWTRDAHRHLGPVNCFAQEDLYTVKWGELTNTDIEKFFFGQIDRDGKAAVAYFTDYEHKGASEKAFVGLLEHMSVQKLRTPKGLGYLSLLARTGNRNFNLILLQQIRRIYCATWTDCVWQIADASDSPTRLIISDQPVTVYNRACFPLSNWCKGFNDPDIRMVATLGALVPRRQLGFPFNQRNCLPCCQLVVQARALPFLTSFAARAIAPALSSSWIGGLGSCHSIVAARSSASVGGIELGEKCFRPGRWHLAGAISAKGVRPRRGFRSVMHRREKGKCSGFRWARRNPHLSRERQRQGTRPVAFFARCARPRTKYRPGQVKLTTPAGPPA